uniref:Uncharacterized protein LOC104236429 n=1 Tax=Nicotiana sylvestris TaxID=4096 RepID=A0A1U7XCQ1_NICSY|nr:PREDICTED: uncharacterized protein LOC104236429 [Nicotiana sylvestris]
MKKRALARAEMTNWSLILRRSVLRALSVKNKLGFINGESRRPSPDSPQFRQWERCDDMVTLWILNSLAMEISDSAEYVNDSVELWRELEDRYDQTNGEKLYQIQKEINDLAQANNNNKGRPFCDYYKRPGLTREKCYKLHGYPQGNSYSNHNLNRVNAQPYNKGNNQNYKFNKGKGSVANVHGTPTDIIHESGDDQNLQDENQNVSLTKEQYGQIMTLLQHFQVGHMGGSSSNSNITTGSANFAGIVVCTSSIDFDKPSCKCFESKYQAPSVKRPQVIDNDKEGLYYLCSRCLRGKKTTLPSTVSVSYCNCILAPNAVKAFVSMIENQFNTSIKIIRSDNGLEFTSHEASSFYQSKGIIHQNTCLYTPQQNDVVERKHKYLLETARALMFQSKLPTRYWEECVMTATYLIKRLPTTYLNNKCPFELLYQKKPNYSYLRSFGCLCYPTVPNIYRDKFELRTTPYIFVGYPFGTKGYKVLSLDTKRIHIFRDVIFHENIFPFSFGSNNASFPAILKTVSFPNYSEDNSQVSPIHIGQGPDSVTSPGIEHHSESFTNDTPFSNDSSPQNSPTDEQSKAPVLRNSSRTYQTPTYLRDYVYQLPSNATQLSNVSHCTPSLNAMFSNYHHITPDALFSESQHLMLSVCHDCEPSSYEEAAINPAWEAAMTQEFEAFHANHTWDLVPLPPGKQAGIDYTETFSPVVKMTTVRVLVTVDIKKG